MNEKISLLERRRSVLGVPSLTTAKRRFTTKKTKDVTEADVKKAVKEIVLDFAPNTHIFMPVQSGYGSPDLDFILSVNGYAFRIETKVNGKQPSERQLMTAAKLQAAGVPVIWIDQNNLEDVAVIMDLLLVGQQGEALHVSWQSRRDYANRSEYGKQTQAQTKRVRAKETARDAARC